MSNVGGTKEQEYTVKMYVANFSTSNGSFSVPKQCNYASCTINRSKNRGSIFSPSLSFGNSEVKYCEEVRGMTFHDLILNPLYVIKDKCSKLNDATP